MVVCVTPVGFSSWGVGRGLRRADAWCFDPRVVAFLSSGSGRSKARWWTLNIRLSGKALEHVLLFWLCGSDAFHFLAGGDVGCIALFAVLRLPARSANVERNANKVCLVYTTRTTRQMPTDPPAFVKES